MHPTAACHFLSKALIAARAHITSAWSRLAMSGLYSELRGRVDQAQRSVATDKNEPYYDTRVFLAALVSFLRSVLRLFHLGVT